MRMTGNRTGFILDLNRCTGCRACELACSTENDLGFGQSWRRIETFNPARDPRAVHHHLSIGCNHCANAPCATACPARAIIRDGRSGLVELNPDRCMGCGYCSWVCPFEAPTYDEAAGVMGKCTLCPERTAENNRPACVEACPTDALTFGSIDAIELSESAPGFPNTDAEPAMRFKPVREGFQAPESTWSVDADVLAAFDAARHPQAVGGDLSHEWPLVIFTLTAASLVAIQTAVVFGAGFSPLGLALIAALAAGVSTLHLGRPGRSRRAVSGVARSWLSREIVIYGVFVVLLGMQIVLPNTVGVGQAAAISGWVCLFAVDRVYDPVRRPRSTPVHSADVLGIAALLTAVLFGHLPTALAIAGIRLLLFLTRQDFLGKNRRQAWATTMMRIVPPAAGLVLMSAGGDPWIAALLVGGGDVFDRILFYLEMKPATVAETLDIDLISAISERA